jgi:hypothetical protein
MSGTIYLQQLPNKNLFINPAFQVNQINLTGTLPDSVALPTQSLGYLSGSNWCFAASGSSTVAYTIDPASEKVTFTGAASTTAIYLLQRIESKDLIRLANKLATITFSFEASNSLLTSVNWSILRPTTTSDVHGTIGTPTQTTIASGTVTIDSTLRRYSVTATLPIQAALGAEFRLSVGAQTSGTWVVSRLQLEEGSVATTFNCGDTASELLRCMRYAQKATNGLQGAVSGSTIYLEKPFKVPMFSTPIMTVTSLGTIINASILQENALDDESFCFQIQPSALNGYVINRKYLCSAHIP